MSPKQSSSGEEVVNHYGAIRLRVTGSANLRPTLYSLDEVRQTALTSLVLSSSTAIEPNRLANFTQQRAKLELRTININETFEISRIIIFIKPVAKSFPETS
jgi:hypothetical protein